MKINTKNYWMLVLVFTLLFSGCSEKRTDIQVAVAANFYSTMGEIVDSFKEENPAADIKLIKGSSGKLTSQILSGAEFDIFLSADFKKPAALYAKGFTKEKPITYALGALVLMTKSGVPLSADLKTLAIDSINHIAVANPVLAPYGGAAMQAIKNSGVEIDTSKFVYGENIIQTYQHIDLAADVGFVSKSLVLQDVSGKTLVEGKDWVEVDTTLYTPIKQGMIILSDRSEEVQKLYKFIQSDKAKEIIKKSGYSF